jgi:predicted ATP-grasp superfamily ATP-dependent carboligase
MVLGGLANALAILRGLSRRGIPVGAAVEEGSLVELSRYRGVSYIARPGESSATLWERVFLKEPDKELRGALLFPCSDDAIEFIGRHAPELGARYLLDGNDPGQRLVLLDKQKTLELAMSLGIPTPRFWIFSALPELEAQASEFVYPVILKPRLSHVFQKRFSRRRYFKANNWDELKRDAGLVLASGLAIMVCEFLAGPDDLACSYYTYRTESGEHLFHYTKRVLRRAPKNEGGGTYHVTQWLPEVAELGQRFFDAMGLIGLGNVEFKRDLRDGKLKIIEVNPRFTAAQGLVTASGLDMPYIIYCHRTGQPLPPVTRAQDGVSQWLPFEDFMAFRQLHQLGELSSWAWLRSVARRHVFAQFDWRDPWPAVAGTWRNWVRPRFGKNAT